MRVHDKDHWQLDGRLLSTLLAVLDTGSITKAADKLGMTQSAVSNLLEKLRELVGDPLFVKSGRGIVATAHAETLAVQARVLLEEMQHFVAGPVFDPASVNTTITVAANDLQRDLLLPALLKRLRETAPGLSLRVINSAVPTPELLRSEDCQLVISPRPPDAGDVLQKRLFEDHYRVFYDAACRDAPRSLKDYLSAEHVTVAYEPLRRLEIDQVLGAANIDRRFVAYVPGFAGIAAFLRGSTYLATAPSLLRDDQLRDLASCAVPVPCPTMPMYLIWHLRYRHDPLQCWVREQVEDIARGIASQVVA
ncbi:LysR family transcriptional regulator [Denitratisoma sp. agr-D3]